MKKHEYDICTVLDALLCCPLQVLEQRLREMQQAALAAAAAPSPNQAVPSSSSPPDQQQQQEDIANRPKSSADASADAAAASAPVAARDSNGGTGSVLSEPQQPVDNEQSSASMENHQQDGGQVDGPGARQTRKEQLRSTIQQLLQSMAGGTAGSAPAIAHPPILPPFTNPYALPYMHPAASAMMPGAYWPPAQMMAMHPPATTTQPPTAASHGPSASRPSPNDAGRQGKAGRPRDAAAATGATMRRLSDTSAHGTKFTYNSGHPGRNLPYPGVPHPSQVGRDSMKRSRSRAEEEMGGADKSNAGRGGDAGQHRKPGWNDSVVMPGNNVWAIIETQWEALKHGMRAVERAFLQATLLFAAGYLYLIFASSAAH